MIDLDEQQNDALRGLANTIGDNAAARAFRTLRFIARLNLTMWRWCNPKGFDRWNHARVELNELERFWRQRDGHELNF